MEEIEKMMLGERSKAELGARLSGLCDELELKVKSISSHEEPHVELDVVDKEMLQNYFIRLRLAITGNQELGIKPNIVDAEVVAYTMIDVFNARYINRLYDRSDTAEALKDIRDKVTEIRDVIGPYEKKKYHDDPFLRGDAFRRIMRHYIDEKRQLREHFEAIWVDDISFNEGFRSKVWRAYINLVESVEAVRHGRIKLPHLQHALSEMPYTEKDIRDQFNDNPAARIKAEEFLVNLRMIKTLEERYTEHRETPF